MIRLTESLVGLLTRAVFRVRFGVQVAFTKPLTAPPRIRRALWPLASRRRLRQDPNAVVLRMSIADTCTVAPK